MADFPLLSTGAVAQYPLATVSSQGTGVIRFVDGTDQRFSVQGRALRQWQIRLSLLNEDGALVPNCRFAASAFSSEYAGIDLTGTSFWVIETNG